MQSRTEFACKRIDDDSSSRTHSRSLSWPECRSWILCFSVSFFLFLSFSILTQDSTVCAHLWSCYWRSWVVYVIPTNSTELTCFSSHSLVALILEDTGDTTQLQKGIGRNRAKEGKYAREKERKVMPEQSGLLLDEITAHLMHKKRLKFKGSKKGKGKEKKISTK